jgi:hypothetical protein
VKHLERIEIVDSLDKVAAGRWWHLPTVWLPMVRRPVAVPAASTRMRAARQRCILADDAGDLGLLYRSRVISALFGYGKPTVDLIGHRAT